MKETVLIIGIRRRCYQVAIKFGYDVFSLERWHIEWCQKERLKRCTVASH
ncbi:MAG: hypothetical protein ACI82S_002115 [Patiriisocius sp.]|jgi:hypothetical protein